MSFKRVLLVALSAALLGLAPGRAGAQADYPNRPVRMVVPFAPGGTTDVIARILAKGLGDELGQQFYIENRGGAGGTLGADVVAKAAPDGYSLLLFHVGMTYGNALFKKLPYDIAKDFKPISLTGVAPSALVVGRDFPAKTVGELIALAKKSPGELNFGSAGIGTSSHLAPELFALTADVKLTHVPFRGGGPAVMATIGGQVQFMIETAGTLMPQFQSGTLRALAVTSERRFADLPDVPTMQEAGLPDYVYTTWYGLWAPANTPADIIAKLNRATVKALASAEVKSALDKAGIEPQSSSAAEFEALIHRDLERWTRVIRNAGIAPQ
jgi:tripartite-type tricarboxylate transporter receptor subunit TctC